MKTTQVQTIVVPTDFSESAERAVVVAVDWATRFVAKIQLIHVWHPPPPSGGHWGASYPTALAREMERAARETLESTRGKIAAEGVDVRSEIVSGKPALQIVACAQRARADLIIMGTRGDSGFRHAVLGSVAERTLRHAKCPVITVGPAPAV